MDVEQHWIERIKRARRSKEADLLISKYYDEMYIFAYRQTFDKELAMDLTQEIFICVLKSIDLYDSSRSAFRTWLYKVATNRIIDYKRSRRNHEAYPVDIETVDTVQEPDFSALLENRELAQKIESYICSLDTSYQEVFRLRVFGSYSFAEIARITAKPEATVKTGYYRLIKQIRKEFYDEYTDAERK
ncbi:MAG: RNA polymerase sigma factor [Clostridiales bacterium]|nr:RNA polymerase sigma factor [Clostridiales bacterium]